MFLPQAALTRSTLGCLGIHCNHLNSKAEATWSHFFPQNACGKPDESAKYCVCYLKGNSCVFLFMKLSDVNSKALWKNDINRLLLSLLTSVWLGDDLLSLCGVCSHRAQNIAGDIPVLLEKLQCSRGWAVHDYCVPGWDRRKAQIALVCWKVKDLDMEYRDMQKTMLLNVFVSLCQLEIVPFILFLLTSWGSFSLHWIALF